MKTNIQWGLRLLKENFFPIKREIWDMRTYDGISVMSFNLKTDKPSDGPNNWVYRRDAILSMIKDYTPDVICCQEVMPHMAKWLKAKIGCNYDCYGRDTFHGTRLDRSIFCNTLGNIIFYNKAKFRMVDRYAFWLSDTPDKPSATWGNKEPRNCVVVELLDNFTYNYISVMCTHLDHTSAEVRERSAQLIVDKSFYARNYMVGYLAGDFNASVDDPELQSLSRCKLFCFPTKDVPTFNGFRGNKKSVIDYIFTNFENQKGFVVLDGYGVPFLSDHYPIIVTNDCL